jgi:hypothetical protein
VLAALADVCGMGRHLIPEISDALKKQGLLETDAQFTTVDEMLDGLEQTSSRLAATINTPPLDVTALRQRMAGHSPGGSRIAAREPAIPRDDHGCVEPTEG